MTREYKNETFGRLRNEIIQEEMREKEKETKNEGMKEINK